MINIIRNNYMNNNHRHHENRIWIGEKGHVPFWTSGKLFTYKRTF